MSQQLNQVIKAAVNETVDMLEYIRDNAEDASSVQFALDNLEDLAHLPVDASRTEYEGRWLMAVWSNFKQASLVVRRALVEVTYQGWLESTNNAVVAVGDSL